ncbi:MAG: hypothetical protein ACXQS8_00565 [Candidatus Helarchaeales archaeon]
MILNAQNITLMIAPVDPSTVIISILNPKSNLGLISMYLEVMAKKIQLLLEKYLN